ncbi:MAG: type IA DNA topoisomerase [Lachnospiraceae bacterium]|nr:type IA DNA topoisomerase [Lachnospiraceae bacterium]
MGKNLFIAEKPSVAKEFAKALKEPMRSFNGYMESEHCIVTWCVGHLVTMSYPDAYDESLKRWTMGTLPFFPPNDQFKYQVIDNVKAQFSIVSGLLNREDVSCIYVCTDSGREGEYIYRLVEQEAHVQGKTRKRVWIDSQTEEEILRGIREAKDLSEYDHLSDSAYLRAKEDYLMGINFSRLLTLKYGDFVKHALAMDKNAVISVGRVMTCVLGMVVDREREIRHFDKTPFYRVVATLNLSEKEFEGEWKAVEGSDYYNSPLLYKENGFKKEENARELIAKCSPCSTMTVKRIEKKKEKKNPPLLYNLAELQNDCSRLFKISPDETLRIAQELYEKKLTTYPRTDARVLSTAVAKEIYKNIKGLTNYAPMAEKALYVLDKKSYVNIAKTRYVNDKMITDHYAIIPTGQGLNALSGLHPTSAKVYELICGRFLSIFYPPAEYEKISLTMQCLNESFFSNFKVQVSKGYLAVTEYSFFKKKDVMAEKSGQDGIAISDKGDDVDSKENKETKIDPEFFALLSGVKKGDEIPVTKFEIKEGETSPPKRYNSGSLILAMENAGQLIEEEELRELIKGSGIGTSATRAEILKKLVVIDYLNLNKKTQIITPTCMGELIYEVVKCSIKSMLEPTLTASWEKGLTQVANGEISSEEYMDKLKGFINRRTDYVKKYDNRAYLNQCTPYVKSYYTASSGRGGKTTTKNRQK